MLAGGAAYLAVGLPGALRWWGAVGLMLDWHLGMAETEGGEPRPLGAADAATLVRAWLVPLVARDPRPVLLAAGYVSDVLDGALARATAPTRLGRDLEAAVDVCFSVAALKALVRSGALPAPVAGAEATRMVTGATLATASWLSRAGPPSGLALRAARATTPIRAAGVLAAACGRRRLGSALVVIGSVASVVAQWRALLVARRM